MRRRTQGTSTKFRHKVDNEEAEARSNPRDSDLQRCIVCKFVNSIQRTTCRMCGSQNWRLQHYPKR